MVPNGPPSVGSRAPTASVIHLRGRRKTRRGPERWASFGSSWRGRAVPPGRHRTKPDLLGLMRAGRIKQGSPAHPDARASVRHPSRRRQPRTWHRAQRGSRPPEAPAKRVEAKRRALTPSSTVPTSDGEGPTSRCLAPALDCPSSARWGAPTAPLPPCRVVGPAEHLSFPPIARPPSQGDD